MNVLHQKHYEIGKTPKMSIPFVHKLQNLYKACVN